MHTEYHKWYSPNLGKDMELKIYGNYGKPFIVFPCSRGRFFDFEGQGMIGRISSWIDNGTIKLYSIDSVDTESWYNFGVAPAVRSARNDQYYKYVTDEVVPFIREHTKVADERPLATGTSMGAYHAVNFFLKHPEVCGGTIALSGLYRLDRNEFQMNAGDIKDVYYNSPIHYMPNLTDADKIEWMKKSQIIICTGQGAWEDEAIVDTKDLEYTLKDKGIPAWVDYWGKDVNHDWPWWYIQMNHFLSKIF